MIFKYGSINAINIITINTLSTDIQLLFNINSFHLCDSMTNLSYILILTIYYLLKILNYYQFNLLNNNLEFLYSNYSIN